MSGQRLKVRSGPPLGGPTGTATRRSIIHMSGQKVNVVVKRPVCLKAGRHHKQPVFASTAMAGNSWQLRLPGWANGYEPVTG